MPCRSRRGGIATVTLPLKPVARLPWLSRAVTTEPIAPPAVVPTGCVVNTSWLAVPDTTLKLLLVVLLGRLPSP